MGAFSFLWIANHEGFKGHWALRVLRTEPCDAQFSKVWGQWLAVNRNSRKLSSKAMLCFCWIRVVNACASLRAWTALLTPKGHSCALIEYVHECLAGWDQHKHPWMSSSLFCEANDHQVFKNLVLVTLKCNIFVSKTLDHRKMESHKLHGLGSLSVFFLECVYSKEPDNAA